VTESNQGPLEDLAPDPASSPPQTGHAAIDDALLGLADLDSTPLSDHHDRLAKAHEMLHEALDPPDDHPLNAESR
jgi:hypothetical protein